MKKKMKRFEVKSQKYNIQIKNSYITFGRVTSLVVLAKARKFIIAMNKKILDYKISKFMIKSLIDFRFEAQVQKF